MEPDDLGLGSYYHHQPQPPSTTTDIRPPPPQMVYPHNYSAPSAVSSPVRRKRGRPRKYGTPEQAAAAKRLSSPPAIKKDLSLAVAASSFSSKKTSLGSSGQGFTPHIINVTAGEDIGQKIMLFMQQNKQEMCVLSASGSISNASLRQSAASGGNITYEGSFDILSLSGSYALTDFGSSSGGLCVCLSSHDGQIVGGGVHGPLIAAGPVQVIVGTFVVEGKKIMSPVGSSVPSLSFLSTPRNVVDDAQNMDGYQFMIAGRGMPAMSPWRSNNASRGNPGYDFSGRLNHEGDQSPQNGDYDFHD